MKLLFICTHNRCRSILSEAIANHLSQGNLTAYSAGSQPAGEVHPLSIKYLQEKNISTDELRSQSWDDFEKQKPDIVITVCDSAANESCPIWFSNGIKVHWGLNDPSKLKGNDKEIRQAFYETMNIIEKRIQKLLEIDVQSIDEKELVKALECIANET